MDEYDATRTEEWDDDGTVSDEEAAEICARWDAQAAAERAAAEGRN